MTDRLHISKDIDNVEVWGLKWSEDLGRLHLQLQVCIWDLRRATGGNGSGAQGDFFVGSYAKKIDDHPATKHLEHDLLYVPLHFGKKLSDYDLTLLPHCHYSTTLFFFFRLYLCRNVVFKRLSST